MRITPIGWLPVPTLGLALTMGVLLHASAGSVHGAEKPDTEPVSANVVALPKFVVTEDRELPPPESWRYAEIPGFEILSTVSQRETLRFVRDFQLLQQVVEYVWPAVKSGGSKIPTMIILCGAGREFESFVPAGLTGNAARATSHFLQDTERSTIVVDFFGEKPPDFPEARDIPSAPAPPAEHDENLGDSGADQLESAGFMTENDPYREFYLQYFRHLIRRAAGRPQPWFEEGLVQLLASMDFSKKHIAVGRIGDGFGGGPEHDFTVVLARRPLMKFEDLFAGEPPARQPDATLYSAQCYAFVHLCLYGEGKRYQKPFIEFIRRTATEAVTEAIFQECFGATYKQMALILRGYTQFTEYQYAEFRAKKGAEGLTDAPSFELREATQAEIGRIKGETYRLGGHLDLARTSLIVPYLRGEKDPRLLAALGLHERSVGRDDLARKFLEAATAAKVERPRAYLELARLRFGELKAGTGGTDGKLDADQLRTVLGPLLIAGDQPPPMGEVYELIAEAWLSAATPPTADDLRLLYTGAEHFPTRLKLIYLAATLAIQHGDTANARKLVEHGLKRASNPQTKLLFQELKTMLPLLQGGH